MALGLGREHSKPRLGRMALGLGREHSKPRLAQKDGARAG